MGGNPFSETIALNVLENSKDADLISFANFILAQITVDEAANEVFKKIKIIDYNGNITTIGSVLSSKKSKLKYVDIWASWCGPCLEGIPYSKSIPGKFDSNEMETFFISIDENQADWKKAYAKLDMQKEESYCVLDDENQKVLEKALQITGIPRYLILDSLNSIQMLRAPAPQNIDKKTISLFFKEKIKESPAGLPPPPPMKRN